MSIALCYLLNTLAAIFSFNCQILSHIAGMSLITWIFLYLATIVFKFCAYHRMFLWYILTNDIINIIDYYLNIPINDSQIIAMNCSIAGIMLFIILYLYVRSNKKSIKEDSEGY